MRASRFEERNKYAQAVIDLMGFLNPHLRDVADFKHKLWDHLHIISGYKIDVDSPYPKPTPEASWLNQNILVILSKELPISIMVKLLKR